MANENNQVFEIGFMMRATWDVHSLNNEGSVGNVVEPRTLVLADGKKTDGISGEILKHVHSFNVWLTERDKSRFCPGCQRLQPQKADMPEYRRTFSGKNNTEAMVTAITNCHLCDLHGFLMQSPAIARRSTIEFGWAVGVPDKVHRDIHIHARHSMSERGAAEQHEGQSEQREVSAQMVYHRPTRSGVYALVSLFQVWRIGLSDITYDYAIDEDTRLARYRIGLEAYKNMILRADGAMTSTRLPHLEALEGVIVVSHRNGPAPIISPLNDSYQKQIETLKQGNGALSFKVFNTVAEASLILDELAERTLYPLRS